MTEPRVALLVRVPASLKGRLTEIAKQERRSLSKQVELLLEKCLENQGRESSASPYEGGSKTGDLIRAGQIGVKSVDPAKCIWDMAILPQTTADKYSPAAKEQRMHPRLPCRLGAELYMQGSEARVRVSVTNISVGGCFVAMPTLPPDTGRLKIVVWVDETKLAIQGVVANRRPGFGISIKFTEMTEVVREQLTAFIQSHLLVRGR